jgi:acyl-[acyl-carrier-protein]-phospholipid O-acyltransferase/long-chain-fatty-acid--[acyl-carrier-protein] ligase
VVSNLKNRGFMSLIAAQFFGAANDNIIKGVLTFMVISGGIWDGKLGAGGQGIAGMILSVPFILLSGYAGQLADRFSKRTVTMWVKFAEIPIAIAAGIGFFSGNLWVTMLAFLALACQSAFFGPAKYGMIPELVDDTQLSRANGMINMMTNLAIIGGTIAAGFISDMYWRKPQGETAGEIQFAWAPGLAMVAVAVVGMLSALFLARLKPAAKDLKFDWNPFATYIHSVRAMSKTRLLMVMLAWGYFYMIAGLVLYVVPEYTNVMDVYAADGTLLIDIKDSEAAILMGIMGISIGVGCALAGYISGDRIEPRLIPIGAAGLVVFFFLLAAIPPWMPDMQPYVRVALSNVSALIVAAGLCAGFYIIPLQAALQKLSPDDDRGRFLGTANCCSFLFITLSAVIFIAIRGGFGDRPQNIFYVCSGLMAVGAAFFLWRLRGTGLLIGSGPAAPVDPS